MSEGVLNGTVDAVVNATEKLTNSTAVLTNIQYLTNELTYLIFDNQIIKNTIGSSYLSGLILVSTAILSVTFGCFASIVQPSNSLPPSKDHPLYDSSDEDSKPTPEEGQLNMIMVIILPVIAACALCGAYYAIKTDNITTVSSYVNKYTIFVSFNSVSSTLSYLYTSISRELAFSAKTDSKYFNVRYKLTLSEDKKVHPSGFEQELQELPESTERERIIKEEMLLENRSTVKKEDQLFNFYFTSANIFGFVSALIFFTLFIYFDGTKNWILNNILGFSLVVMGISKGGVPNFKLATLFLTLFFFYDIYFVFGTDVMASVATTIEIPAKLMVPNKVSKSAREISSSILGLGDLVLPGSFIALCLRFDLYNYHDKNPNTEFHFLNEFEKPYFISSLVGYLIGLLVTFKIVEYYETGQPALLYLCPSIMLAAYSTAIYRGELSKLWNYDETYENKKETPKKDEVEIDIICSKETLFLSSEIAEEDIDDPEDEDYVDNDDSINENDADTKWEKLD